MSWIERMLEERLAEAASSGELAAPRLEGKPIPDLHWERPQGWWAKQFFERELSHDRHADAASAIAVARAGFWRATSPDEVRTLVAEANAFIDAANVNLVDGYQLERFDAADIVERWRKLRR